MPLQMEKRSWLNFWIRSRRNTKQKAFREIDLLERFGSSLKEPYVKHIDGEIWELRIRFSSDISRIFYFTWNFNTIVLLHGFVKKTQKTPRGEIETAQKRLLDYKSRHALTTQNQ